MTMARLLAILMAVFNFCDQYTANGEPAYHVKHRKDVHSNDLALRLLLEIELGFAKKHEQIDQYPHIEGHNHDQQ